MAQRNVQVNGFDWEKAPFEAEGTIASVALQSYEPIMLCFRL